MSHPIDFMYLPVIFFNYAISNKTSQHTHNSVKTDNTLHQHRYIWRFLVLMLLYNKRYSHNEDVFSQETPLLFCSSFCRCLAVQAFEKFRRD